jgi:hypothetical protein
MTGARGITGEFLAEADKLSIQKHNLEMEKAKLMAEIDCRKRTVADRDVVAKALLRMREIFLSLPQEDKKELIRLIVREIVVNVFDPEGDPKAGEKGIFKTRIRTKWYLVNDSLYASDLFPDTCKIVEISSDFDRNGSKGRTRTYWKPVFCLHVVAHSCLSVFLPTREYTRDSLVAQALSCIFVQQSAKKVVRDCAVVRELCGSQARPESVRELCGRGGYRLCPVT